VSLPGVLQPYSAWVLTNRNSIIVVLGFVLFGITCFALIKHWQVQNLERDLAAGADRAQRQTPPPAWRTMPAPPVDQEPEAPGGLPPVRGGRGYARNLGSALQKAPAQPPIYSPPTPSGWNPNTAPQQHVGRPAGGPFSPAPAPWGNPAPQSPMAWPPVAPAGVPGVSGPPGQPIFQGPPPAWPSYQPGGLMPAGSGAPAPPSLPQGPPSPFGFPGFAQGPAPAGIAPPGFPVQQAPAPVVYPTFQPPAEVTPAPAPEPEGSAKRGKPKRRRFNLSVLEGIEKKVQGRLSSAPAEVGAVPTAVPAAPIETPAPEPPAPPPPAAPQPAVAARPTPPVKRAPIVPPPPPVVAEAALPPAPDLAPAEPSPTPASASQPEHDRDRDHRTSMRAMMFGEEALPASAAEPVGSDQEAADAIAPEPEPEAAEQETGVEAPAIEEPVFTFRPASGRDQAEVGAEPEPALEAPPTEWLSPQPAEAVAAAAHDEEIGAPTSELALPELTAAEPATEAEAGLAPFTYEHEAVDASDSGVAPSIGGSSTRWGADALTDEPPPVPVDDEPKPSAGTIVIIEDDAAVAEYYATLFRGNGYRVEVANDGVSGVDLCAKVQPEVIMLDVMMPRQNGILVLQTLRASDETRNTPVVVLSNFSEPTLIKRALQLGALEYVIKTQVEGAALLQAVPRWMHREKAFAA
jgi:CheY-like chemotaxis protein